MKHLLDAQYLTMEIKQQSLREWVTQFEDQPMEEGITRIRNDKEGIIIEWK